MSTPSTEAERQMAYANEGALKGRTCEMHPALPVLDLSRAIPSDCYGLHSHAHAFPSPERHADPETGRMKRNETPSIPTIRPCAGRVRHDG